MSKKLDRMYHVIRKIIEKSEKMYKKNKNTEGIDINHISEIMCETYDESIPENFVNFIIEPRFSISLEDVRLYYMPPSGSTCFYLKLTDLNTVYVSDSVSTSDESVSKVDDFIFMLDLFKSEACMYNIIKDELDTGTMLEIVHRLTRIGLLNSIDVNLIKGNIDHHISDMKLMFQVPFEYKSCSIFIVLPYDSKTIKIICMDKEENKK